MRHLKNISYKRPLLLVLCFFLCLPLWANNNNDSYTKADCDSIIHKGIKNSEKGNYIKALEYFTIAREMAVKEKWDKEIYSVLFNMGFAYYSMFDDGEALKYFLDAYNIAITQKWTVNELECLNNIANLYTREKMYDKAIEYYTKASEKAVEENIESHIGLPLMNLGYIYNRLDQPEKARPYLQQSIKLLENDFLLSAKVLLLENDLLLGDILKARKGAWDMYNKEPNVAENGLEMFLWIIISKTYFKENQYAQAVSYAQRALNSGSDPEYKKMIFKLMADIYEKSGSYHNALRYKDSIFEAERKLTERKNGRMFENNRVKFEIQSYKNQLYAKEEKLSAERKTFYAIIVIICAVVVILVLIFRQKKIIAERNRNITELNLEKEKNHNLELEREVTKALLEQERLNDEIEAKNRKLSAKALYLSDRNEIIEEIVAYLSKRPKLAKDQTLANHVSSLKAYLRADKEWDNFIKHFEEVNQGFLSRLKEQHPDLTVNDIRFIAYIYMNLSVKEIATILNITIVAAKKRKERLVAKMEISKEIDIYNYISAV